MRRDPHTGFTKIKAFPVPEIDLTPLYEILKQKDTQATWHLVGNAHVLLDGSTINPHAKKSSLQLSAILEILKGMS